MIPIIIIVFYAIRIVERIKATHKIFYIEISLYIETPLFSSSH